MVLTRFCYVLWLYHSFKGRALPPCLLFQGGRKGGAESDENVLNFMGIRVRVKRMTLRTWASDLGGDRSKQGRSPEGSVLGSPVGVSSHRPSFGGRSLR